MAIKGHVGHSGLRNFLSDWDSSVQHAKKGFPQGSPRIPYVVHNKTVYWGDTGMSNSHKNVLLENNIQSSNTTAMGFLTMWPRAESGEKILIEHTGGSQTYKTNPLHPDDRRAIEEFVKAQMPKRKIVIETHDKH